MSDAVQFNPNALCERCGRFGAFEFDGQRLCAECYETRGSCCPEFGVDDLWSEDGDTNVSKAAAKCPPEGNSATE